MDHQNTPFSERTKRKNKKSIRCSLEVRGLPLVCFYLPGDGRKWHQAAHSRYKLLLTLASYANPDGTFVRDRINFSPRAKTLLRHIASTTLYRLTNDLRELGWVSWTREKTHYGRRTYRIHFPTQKQVSDSIKKHLPDSRIREVITPSTTGGVIGKSPSTTGGVITSHIGGQLQQTAPVKPSDQYSPPSLLRILPSLKPSISARSAAADSSPNTPGESDTTAAARAFSAFGFEASFGHPRFKDAVIRSAEKIQNGNTLEIMEGVIVELDGKVPPSWYARKHFLETIPPETSVAQPQSPKSDVEEVQGHCAAVLSRFHHAAEKFPAIAETLRTIAEAFERCVAAACDSPHGFDMEALEKEIEPLDEEVFRLLATAAGNDVTQRFRHEVQRQVAPYRMKIRADRLVLIERQYFQKRLLDAFGLPRLSQFFMLPAPVTTPSSEVNPAKAPPCEIESATEEPPWWPKSLDEAVDFVLHASAQPIDGDAWLRAQSRAHRKAVQFRNSTGEFRRPEKRREFIELLKRGAQRTKANAAARAKRKERRAMAAKQPDTNRQEP